MRRTAIIGFVSSMCLVVAMSQGWAQDQKQEPTQHQEQKAPAAHPPAQHANAPTKAAPAQPAAPAAHPAAPARSQTAPQRTAPAKHAAPAAHPAAPARSTKPAPAQHAAPAARSAAPASNRAAPQPRVSPAANPAGRARATPERAAPPVRVSPRTNARIPDLQYRSHFGRAHRFRLHPVVVGGYSRFQYDGFWFGFLQPLPPGWSWSDDFYIVYQGGGYYLCDPLYPGVEVAITVVS